MNIEAFRIFCDLAQLRNFSRTAEKHSISQSAISQQLAQLEMNYKCQLINRKKRPLSLTREGQLFYNACQDIIERYDQVNSELTSLSRSSSRINLAAIFSIGMHTLQPYVKKFMAIYPNVNLSVEYYSAVEIYDGILKSKIDIGVVAVPRKDKNINVYPFVDEPLMLVCGKDHPLSQKTSVDIHNLQGEKFIALEKDLPTRTLIDNILNQYNVNVRTVMEFDNTETIKRAVEINAGLSILPQPIIRTEVASGTLKALSFSNDKIVRPTGIIIRKDKTLTQAGRYLIELLQKGDL